MDTIMIIRDSVATCLKETAEICQPCIKESTECCSDVIIVGIICITILLLAIITVFAYFKQKADERKLLESQVNSSGHADSNNKVNAEYISKLLKHLESLAAEENVDKYNKNGSDRYIKELKNLIKKGTVTDEE